MEEAQSALRKVHRLRRQATLDDELLTILINTGRLSADTVKEDIMNHFGIKEIPFGSHAGFLVKNEQNEK